MWRPCGGHVEVGEAHVEASIMKARDRKYMALHMALNFGKRD